MAAPTPLPIVISMNGYGLRITESANGQGLAVVRALNGRGIPVVIVASGGRPSWDLATQRDMYGENCMFIVRPM